MSMFIFISVTGAAVSASDSSVTVNFNQSEKFTDFKTQANTRAKDRERLMQQLSELMQKSARKAIPTDHTLEISIDNIDMAGTFLYGRSDLYRVVQEFDKILIDFSYQLKDSTGEIVKHGDVNLTSRDSKPVRRSINKYRSSHFAHEMPLFDKWVKKTFKLYE
ncbi:MAG: DUF3016 domain-containing protein [Proteobacteria bacterium]|nr:DUF3016 domain-containing protein [Pseudomonadota bacterium]